MCMFMFKSKIKTSTRVGDVDVKTMLNFQVHKLLLSVGHLYREPAWGYPLSINPGPWGQGGRGPSRNLSLLFSGVKRNYAWS